MIELVLSALVASDDALLKSSKHPLATPGTWIGRLAEMIDMSEKEAQSSISKSPLSVLEKLNDSSLAELNSYVLYGLCLGEEMLNVSLDFARSRTTFGKPLLSHQAVALRIANVYLNLLAIEQILNAYQLDLPDIDDERRHQYLQHAAELLLEILRNTAQVMAGHGYVDNERFGEMHEAAFSVVRILVRTT